MTQENFRPDTSQEFPQGYQRPERNPGSTEEFARARELGQLVFTEFDPSKLPVDPTIAAVTRPISHDATARTQG